MKYGRIPYRPTMPPGLRLLTACLRGTLGRGEDAEIRVLCERSCDWDGFIKLVERHRVVSSVYPVLKRAGGDGVPQAVLADLEAVFLRSAHLALGMAAELVRLVKQFEKAGIPALPFKGPVVALQAYGQVGSRHMRDLDIMVAPGRALEAEGMLRGQGYERTHPGFELTPRQTSAYLRGNHHFGYVHRKTGIRVELHWRFGQNRHLFPLRFGDLWRKRQVLQLGGVAVPALSCTDTILLLCTHGANHHWYRLFWLNDVARLVARKAVVDWHGLMVDADRLGLSRVVAEGLVLGNFLLGSPLPGPVQVYAAADKSLERLTAMALYLIYRTDGPSFKPFTRPYVFDKMRSLLLRKDLRYRLGGFAAMLGADRHYENWERVPLPDRLFPLYYLVRPVMWFFRWYVLKSRVYREGATGRNIR